MFTLQTVFGTVTCNTQEEMTTLLATLAKLPAAAQPTQPVVALAEVSPAYVEAHTVKATGKKATGKSDGHTSKYTVEGYDCIGRDGKHDVSGYDTFTNNLQGAQNKAFRDGLKEAVNAYWQPTGWKIPHAKDAKPFGKVALQALFDKLAQ